MIRDLLEVWLSLATSGDFVGVFFALVAVVQVGVIVGSVAALVLGWVQDHIL